ncbi:hypothetical protein [Nocardia sp. NRRL S-836]|uniref:hypothetical protein n=1 Tax=Nocardia sp. NRRL S-836 TaxID=1519492 RepID=UPI0018D14D6C|nr:hypothetical protein [Nocardia sp. NRRL S-836]
MVEVVQFAAQRGHLRGGQVCAARGAGVEQAFLLVAAERREDLTAVDDQQPSGAPRFSAT